jgi:hypothetical protein
VPEQHEHASAIDDMVADFHCRSGGDPEEGIGVTELQPDHPIGAPGGGSP